MATSQPFAQPMRLLFIDDDNEQAQSVLTPLQSTTLACRHLTTNRFNAKMLTDLDLHIVLLHLNLPEIGSAALCASIRAVSRLPIVIVSQRTRREDLFHFLNQGADDFIPIRTLDATLMLVRILTLLRRTYEYDRPVTQALQLQPVSEHIPRDWLTCESCNYMGPNHRFERTDALGDRVLRCPNCNHSSSNSLTFNL